MVLSELQKTENFVSENFSKVPEQGSDRLFQKRASNGKLELSGCFRTSFIRSVPYHRYVRLTGTFGMTRESTKNDFSNCKNRFFGFVRFFRQNVQYGIVRYGWIYTVRYGFLSLVWFGIFPNASLLHVSLVGTRGRDVPLREIANSTSLVRRLNYAIPSKRFTLPNKYIGGGIGRTDDTMELWKSHTNKIQY